MRKSFRLAALTGILGALCWLGLSSRSEAYPIGVVFCDSHGVRCSVDGQRISCYSKYSNTFGGYCYCGHYDSLTYLTYTCHDYSIPEALFSREDGLGSRVVLADEASPANACAVEGRPADAAPSPARSAD